MNVVQGMGRSGTHLLHRMQCQELLVGVRLHLGKQDREEVLDVANGNVAYNRTKVTGQI